MRAVITVGCAVNDHADDTTDEAYDSDPSGQQMEVRRVEAEQPEPKLVSTNAQPVFQECKIFEDGSRCRAKRARSAENEPKEH